MGLNAVGGRTLAVAVLAGALTVTVAYWEMSRVALHTETHRLVHLHLQIGWTAALPLVAVAAWR